MAYVKAVASSISNEDTGVLGPGFTTLDGVMLSAGDRILLTRQTNTAQNGVWIWQASGTQLARPTATGDQYATGASFDNATIIWVTGGTLRAGTVWGIDPAKRVTVDTTPHDLTRVSLPPVQCRVATTADINLANTFHVIDGQSVTDGAITNGSGTLTCATSAPFKASDVGKRVVVAGAGVAAADLVALITAFTSASVVTVSPTASTTVGPANVEFGVALVGNGQAGSDIVLVTDGSDQQASSHAEKSEAVDEDARSLRGCSRPDEAAVLRSVLRREATRSRARVAVRAGVARFDQSFGPRRRGAPHTDKMRITPSYTAK